jgi:hypothetical protein
MMKDGVDAPECSLLSSLVVLLEHSAETLLAKGGVAVTRAASPVYCQHDEESLGPISECSPRFG